MESAAKEEVKQEEPEVKEEGDKEETVASETAPDAGANPEKKKKKHKKHKSNLSVLTIEKAHKKEGGEAKEEEKKSVETKPMEQHYCERKLDNSIFRKIGDWKEGEFKQT